jgi:hypothetical protein
MIQDPKQAYTGNFPFPNGGTPPIDDLISTTIGDAADQVSDGGTVAPA